jgi:hypothetical protein
VTSIELSMPVNWSDHSAWNLYYSWQISNKVNRDAEAGTGSFPIDRLPALANDLKSRGWRKVWIPGCGLSPLGKYLAHLGLSVVVTDVSPVAVEFQSATSGQNASLVSKLGMADSEGSLIAEVHDFRQEFQRAKFDLIINVRAFQGFEVAEMVQIARSHATALAQGRYAYFDTINVQGESRDQLEKALEDGGFWVPFRLLDSWYRRELRETGIPHVFILGQPMIPQTGVYAGGGAKWETDCERLRAISAEHRSRSEAEQSSWSPDAKVAQLIYSTG